MNDPIVVFVADDLEHAKTLPRGDISTRKKIIFFTEKKLDMCNLRARGSAAPVKTPPPFGGGGRGLLV